MPSCFILYLSFFLRLMGKRFSKQRHKPRFTKVQIPWLIRGVIRSNNLETMQYLLSYPNDVNPSMVIDGVCPLNLAIELGHLQMVKLLIKAGADIHATDATRYPLHQVRLAFVRDCYLCPGRSIWPRRNCWCPDKLRRKRILPHRTPSILPAFTRKPIWKTLHWNCMCPSQQWLWS